MKQVEDHILVIFGASGDLTQRKLIPSVFDLCKTDYLPDNFAVLGVGRTNLSDEDFRDKMVYSNEHAATKAENKAELDRFAGMLHYQAMDTKASDSYRTLKERLAVLCQSCNTKANYIFYMSTPPSLFEIIARELHGQGLANEADGWKRLIVEKPFGYDLQSGKSLNRSLLSYFDEDQVYRIDHYLGKETVQNLLVTRFANSIFEPLWNRNYIHHVEITHAENIGVGSRGGYYDGSGALRDMVQNHLMQLVALTAMEPPVNMDPDSIHNEKVKLFQSLRALTDHDLHHNIIRGQYTSSHIRGEFQTGYREATGVPENSKTETFVAMKFFIDNWRWAGVPFYIRSGKALPTRVAEIVIHFKPTPHHLFQQLDEFSNSDNQLVIRIQPNEGMLLKFGMKVPGSGFHVKKVNMDFHYSELTNDYVPAAYERLLLDAMLGDSTLFSRGDSVNAAWEFVDPILNAWQNDDSIKLYGYPAGTWGPEQADALIEGNYIWRYPCKNLADDGEFCEL